MIPCCWTKPANWSGRRWAELRKVTRRSPWWIETVTIPLVLTSSSRYPRFSAQQKPWQIYNFWQVYQGDPECAFMYLRQPSWARRRQKEPWKAWTMTGKILVFIQIQFPISAKAPTIHHLFAVQEDSPDQSGMIWWTGNYHFEFCKTCHILTIELYPGGEQSKMVSQRLKRR